MNILLVYKEADIATYKMLEGLSKLEDFNIYIASPQSYTDKNIYGNCTPLDLPVITSKFNWNVIRALRKIIKTYRIDLIYSPSSSGLSNALFASIGTRAKNIAYREIEAVRSDLLSRHIKSRRGACRMRDQRYRGISLPIHRTKKTNDQHKAI